MTQVMDHFKRSNWTHCSIIKGYSNRIVNQENQIIISVHSEFQRSSRILKEHHQKIIFIQEHLKST